MKTAIVSPDARPITADVIALDQRTDAVVARSFTHLHALTFGCLWLTWFVWDCATRRTINPFESGVYFNGARRLLDGQTIYRDFFSIYGAGQYYLYAAALWLTRNLLVAESLIAGVVTATNLCLTYAIARRLTASRFVQLVALIACVTYADGGYRLSFMLGTLVSVMKFGDGHRYRWLAIGGGLAAANLAIQQDVTVYAFAAAALAAAVLSVTRPTRAGGTILREFGTAWLALTLGFVLVAGLWLGLMAVQGTAAAYIRHAFVIPLSTYDRFNFGHLPLPWQAPPITPGVVSVWAHVGLDGVMRWFFYTLPFYLFPAVDLVVLVWSSWRLTARAGRGDRHRTRHVAMLAVAAVALLMCRPSLKTADELKLKANSLPSILLVCAVLAPTLAATDKSKATVLSTARWTGLAALAAFTVYPFLQSTLKPMLRRDVAMAYEVRLAGNADVLAVSRYLTNTQNRGPIFCVPDVPLLYVTTGRPNATGYDYLDPIIDPVVGSTLLSQLESRPPTQVVINSGRKFWNRYEFGHEFGVPVAEFIHRRYTPVFTAGQLTVYELIPASSPLSTDKPS